MLEDEAGNSESFVGYGSIHAGNEYELAHPDHLITVVREFARLWGSSHKNIASLRRNYLDFFNQDGSITLENILALSEVSIKNASLPPEKRKEKAEARLKRVLDYDRVLGGPVAIVPYEDTGERELALYDLALKKQNTGEIPSDATIYHPYKRHEELVGTEHAEHQKIYHPYWEEVGTFKGWHHDKKTGTIIGMFAEFPDAGLKKLAVNFSPEHYSNKLASNVWGNYSQASSAQRS